MYDLKQYFVNLAKDHVGEPEIKQFLKRLDNAHWESQFKVVPKIKISAVLIRLLQQTLSDFTPSYSSLEMDGEMLLLTMCVLAHEGSQKSAEAVELYIDRGVTSSKKFDFANSMWRNLIALGTGVHIKKLTQKYFEQHEAMLNKSELVQLLKELDISSPNPPPPKGAWFWHIKIAENEPPSSLSGKHTGPWIGISINPDSLDYSWEIFVRDGNKAQTSIEGKPNPILKKNDLNLPALLRFSDTPSWIQEVSKKLEVTFNFDKTKISGSRSLKKEKLAFINWLSNGRVQNKKSALKSE
jgi:hypothetical protein